MESLYVPLIVLTQVMKKKSDAEILREWGIDNPNFRKKHLRYQTPMEKGIYWYWFSLEVRQRDVKKWGTCISCGKQITVDTCDAGHFVGDGDYHVDMVCR